MDEYRQHLAMLPLEEVEAAAAAAEALRDSTPPTAPFFEELVDIARIAREVAIMKASERK